MTYEYECHSCGHKFEVEQRITDEQLVECPECHVNSLRRLISYGGGFVLKGNCWYSDGYSKKTTNKESVKETKN